MKKTLINAALYLFSNKLFLTGKMEEKFEGSMIKNTLRLLKFVHS
jgi:hypothetical protein